MQKEYIEREWLIDCFDTIRQNMIMRQVDKYPAACAFAIKEIKDFPAADVVSKDLYEQIKWERDVALAQLKDCGVSLGEKADVVEVVRCKDCKYSGMHCFGTSKEETLACLEIEEDGFIRFATAVKADDYCSRGAKMDKEE